MLLIVAAVLLGILLGLIAAVIGVLVGRRPTPADSPPAGRGRR